MFLRLLEMRNPLSQYGPLTQVKIEIAREKLEVKYWNRLRLEVYSMSQKRAYYSGDENLKNDDEVNKLFSTSSGQG